MLIEKTNSWAYTALTVGSCTCVISLKHTPHKIAYGHGIHGHDYKHNVLIENKILQAFTISMDAIRAYIMYQYVYNIMHILKPIDIKQII